VQGLTLASFGGGSYCDTVGSSVAAGADLTGDGISEIVAGSPAFDNGNAWDSGRVIIYDAVANQQVFVDSSILGERLGSSVAVAHDYDGDGFADIIAGAPNSPNGSAYEVGRVVVLSGGRVASQTGPYEIYSFAYGGVTPPVNHSDPQPNFHFGAAVNACADLNGDGVGEILVGAPGYFTQSLTGGWNFRGAVRVVSGATGLQITGVTGGTTDRLGDSFAGAVGDLNGDGFSEFIVAGSLSDAGGTDSGVVRCYRLFPLAPSSYCVGKVNSQGCTPFIGFSGSASATSGAPFAITASNVINQQNGILFYGSALAAVPFQGGTKCVANPIVRTPLQNAGGATSGSSCTGTFSFDFNAWTASAVDPALVAAREVFAQYWSRDPASASTTSLSNALRFVINP
jgi:hypothetical protein